MGEEAANLEFHLGQCRSCRFDLALRTVETNSSPHRVEGTRIRAVLLAVFGTELASVKSLKAALKDLRSFGSTTSGLEDELIWAAIPLKHEGVSNGDGLTPEDWLDRLLTLVRSWPDLGVIATVGLDVPGPVEPFDRALDIACNHRPAIRVGEIRLCPPLDRLLSPFEPRLAPLHSQNLDVRRWLPAEQAPRWTDLPVGNGHTLRALVFGDASGFDGMELNVYPRRIFRGERRRNSADARQEDSEWPPATPGLDDETQPDPLRPSDLMYGDILRIEVCGDWNGWLHIARQRDTSLTFPHQSPVRLTEQTMRFTTELILGDEPGVERAVFVVAPQPLKGLRAKLEKLRDEAHRGRHAVLIEVLHLLHDIAGQEPIALAMGSDHLHKAGRPFEPVELNLALSALSQDDNRAAMRHLHEILQQRPALQEVEYARFLMGMVLRRQGRLKKAAALLKRVEATAYSQGDLRLAGSAAREAGRAFTDMRRLGRGERFLKRALRAHQTLGDRLEEARDLLNLGWLHWCAHRFTEARESYRQAHDYAYSVDPHLLLTAYRGLGQIYHDLGQLGEAENAYLQALGIAEQIRNHRGRRGLMGDLGLLAMERGDYDTALRRFVEQRTLAEQQSAVQSEGLARVNLACAYIARGQRAAARRELISAQQLFASRSLPSSWLCCVYLAQLTREDGNLAEAEQWLEPLDNGAVRADREVGWRYSLEKGIQLELRGRPEAEHEYQHGIHALEQVRATLPRSSRTGFLESSVALYQGWLNCLARRKAPAAELIEAMERSRARDFVEALSERREEEVRYRLEGDYRALARIQGSLRPLSEVQSLLKPAETLLAVHALPNQLLWYRVTHEKLDYCPVLLPLHALERLCTDAKSAFRGERASDLHNPLRALSEATLAPISDWLDEIELETAIGIACHGPLYGLPLHALPLPPTCRHAGKPLLECANIFYVPSVQSAAEWMASSPEQGQRVLVLADSLTDLPHARSEAEKLQEFFPAAHVAVGSDVTLDTLQTKAPEACLLHLALHAWREDHSRPAALQLAPPPAPPGSLDAHHSLQQDALLDVKEIARLHLRAPLVVLSACASGDGALNAAGDGPDLLSWAFLASGARAVIASAWDVSDSATCMMMREFYGRLRAGHPPLVALCEAQRELMRKGSPPDEDVPDPPYSWAAFFLTGDWRTHVDIKCE